MVTVGSSAVVGKRMVEDLPVFLASGLRFGLAAVILVPLLRWRAGGWPDVGRSDLATLFLQALTGVFGFSLFWLFGLRQTSASEGGIVASTTPAVIALASALLLGERLGGRGLAGIALAVGGVGAMTVLGETAGVERGPNPTLGNGLIAGAVVSEALFLVLGKRVGSRVAPLAIATVVTCFGFALFLPLALYEAFTTDLAAVPPVAWLAVVYYALGPTVLGYVLLYNGLARVSASTSAVFTGVIPISALLLAHVVLGESILWAHLVGVACVLLAMGLTIAEPGVRTARSAVRRGWGDGRRA